MSLMKKALFGTVALAAMVSNAQAVQIGAVTVGGVAQSGTATYNLASEIVFSTGTTGANVGTVVFEAQPTTGNLPTGNFLLTVTLTGAVFNSTIGSGTIAGIEASGTPGCDAVSANINDGGGAGASTVSFVISNGQNCGIGDGIQVTLPTRVTNSGPVGITAGFTLPGVSGTAGQVDGPAVSRSNVVSVISAFTPVVASAFTGVTNNPSQLTIASGFRQFQTGSGFDTLLGQVWVGQTSGTFSDLSGTAVGSGSLGTGTVTVTGDFTGFVSSASTSTTGARLFLTAGGSSTDCSQTGTQFTIATGNQSATLALADTDVRAIISGALSGEICVLTASGTTASVLNSSAYSGTLGVNYVSPLTGSESASSSIGSISREGTSIVFPWVSSGTQAGVSGSSNTIRLGNTSSSAITGLFVRVVNQVGAASTALVAVPPAAGTTAAIPANGERVITSTELETLLGNFTRGDVEFVVESMPSNLTARRLVFNSNGSFTELSPGTIGTTPQ